MLNKRVYLYVQLREVINEFSIISLAAMNVNDYAKITKIHNIITVDFFQQSLSFFLLQLEHLIACTADIYSSCLLRALNPQIFLQ